MTTRKQVRNAGHCSTLEGGFSGRRNPESVRLKASMHTPGGLMHVNARPAETDLVRNEVAEVVGENPEQRQAGNAIGSQDPKVAALARI